MRVGVVGVGVIGKRVVDAVGRHPDLTLAAVAVRSGSGYPLARPGLPYFAAEPAAEPALRRAGIVPVGSFADMLANVDVVVDCGPAGTGITRLPHYSAAGVRALLGGGERADQCGPIVHPDCPLPPSVTTIPALRLPSCNTTALARVLAAIGPERLTAVEATLLRCATDTDKAGKGVANGIVVPLVPSHHQADLRQLMPALDLSSAAVTVSMVSGHVIRVDLVSQAPMTVGELAAALSATRRIVVAPPGRPLRSDLLRDRMAGACRPWDDRYELVVGIVPRAPGRRHTLWLALDNEAITIPETLDMLQLVGGHRSAGEAQAVTDATLRVGSVARLLFPTDRSGRSATEPV